MHSTSQVWQQITLALFDYFCFCEGDNYNVDQLIGGAISCELLEVNESSPNIATYVVLSLIHI